LLFQPDWSGEGGGLARPSARFCVLRYTPQWSMLLQ
jgi:hypothetical protein